MQSYKIINVLSVSNVSNLTSVSNVFNNIHVMNTLVQTSNSPQQEQQQI